MIRHCSSNQQIDPGIIDLYSEQCCFFSDSNFSLESSNSILRLRRTSISKFGNKREIIFGGTYPIDCPIGELNGNELLTEDK